ncbi:MAG: tetratricopeptide repeat protein [Gemmatimonadaceae bacterium]|nr:tetratricopeptide repeat protein [Chitinophagaceae bacterium]
MLLKFTCYLLPAVFFCQFLFAQNEITVKESYELQFKARKIVETELKDLFNIVSNADFETKAILDIIHNSHSGTFNKIFDNSSVIIEDDINPGYRTPSNTRDVPVDRYLTDLDLLYTKTNTPSIVFTILKVSNIKKYKETYVKVYFTSFFRNQHKRIDTAYNVNNRVAEVFMKKDGKGWMASIARIGFFNPTDTTDDFTNDVTLLRNVNANTLSQDSISAMREMKSIEEQLRAEENKKLIETQQKENEAFNNLMQEGEKAFDISDYTTAVQKYKDAQALRPYDPMPNAKIKMVAKAKSTSELSKKDLFNDLILKAKTSVRRREYKEALDAYGNAREIDPVEIALYDKEILDLSNKYRQIDKLQELYKIGKFKDAISEYNSLIKKNKNYSDYYLGRGKCYDRLGENSKALKDFNTAYELDNNNIDALAQSADLYRRMNKYPEAIRDYNSYLILDKENPKIYLELSNLRMLNNNSLTEAIDVLDIGLKIKSLQVLPDLYLRKGLLLVDKKDYKNAVTNFTSVIKIDSNHGFGYFSRGRTHLLLKQVQNAAYDFQSARDKGVDSQYIKQMSAYAESFYERAAMKFNNNQQDSAMTLINYAISVYPMTDKYHYNKGEYFFAGAKYPEAIKSYDRTIELNGNYTDAFYKRGLSWYHLSEFNTAVKDLTEAIRQNPQYLVAVKRLGDSYFYLNNYASASANYEAAIKLINSSKANNNELAGEVYNLLGKAYYHQNNYEKSISSLRSAIGKDKMMAEAFYNRGLSYYKSGNLESAIEDFKQAVSLNAKPAIWNYYLAKASHDKKNFGDASNYFNSALTLDTAKKFADAYYLRGKSNYELKNWQAALPDYQLVSAQRLDSGLSSFNYEMATVYLNQAKYDSAIAYYNRDYVKDSSNGFLSYGIASAMLLKGKVDESLVWFEKCFKTKQKREKDIKNDPLIASIQDDKRFKALLKKY